MSIIHLETTPIGGNNYQFIQTWIDQDKCLNERLTVEKHDDRMIAAMTNVGRACRWLFDTGTERGTIVITSDKDGKDYRYGGEHDDLWKAIHSRADYQDSRLKYSIIYGKHVAYLDRIRELADQQEICFARDVEALNDLKYKAAEFVTALPQPRANSCWTRATVLKISMTGSHNKVICQNCGKSIIYQQADTFKPFSVQGKGGAYNKLIKNNKALVQYFLDTHCKLHNITK